MDRSTRVALAFLAVFVAAALTAAAAGGASAASLVWTRTYDRAPNEADAGLGVAAAADGSVYVAGLTTRAAGDHDLLLRKYSPSGAAIWTKTFDGALHADDAAGAVAVAPDGSVYVAGDTDTATTNLDLLLRKHAPGGGLRWQRTYNAPDNLSDRAYAVAVGANGCVYVAGVTGAGGPAIRNDLLLVKYTPAGARAWVRTYGSPGAEVRARGVAVAGNSVYVVGDARPAGGSDRLLLRKYTVNGALVWSRTFDKARVASDRGNAVAVDRNGEVYVTGHTSSATQDENVVVRKYSPAGAVRWTRYYNNRHNGGDEGNGIAVAADGTLVVSGYSVVGTDGYVLFLRYAPSGALLQVGNYTGGAVNAAAGLAVAAGPGSAFYITGFLARLGASGNTKLLLQKYQ